MKRLKITNTWIWITFFSIAMAFLESAVVVYLRVIYYPLGFEFPLAAMEGAMVVTELWRELATMVMLLSVSVIAGKTLSQCFAYFIYCFGLWDIFYYVFLYLLLGWPASLLTWDILFLLPVTWVGPVLAPILVSLTMIAIAVLILSREKQNQPVRFTARVWFFLLAGAAVIFTAFTLDYTQYVLDQYSVKELWNLSGDVLFDTTYQYIPQKFNWYIFIMGELLIIFGAISMVNKKK